MARSDPPKPTPPTTGDRFLRYWGFAIHARPEGKPAVWRDRRTGKLHTEREAYAAAGRRASEASRNVFE